MDVHTLDLLSQPAMTIQDGVKLLYQQAFAGGHLIEDPESSLNRLERELDSLHPEECPSEELFTPLGNGLCRLSLWGLRRLEQEGNAVSRQTVNRLFVHTAATHRGDKPTFSARLEELPHLCETGELPWDAQKVRTYLEDYQRRGCPAVHHSECYRAAYHPAYRVVTADAMVYWPVFLAVDRLLAQKPQGTIAIDGGSGSGKSHLAKLLTAVYDLNLVHMDDFFLQDHQRAPQRLAEPGGNLDRERVQREVIDQLGKRRDCSYQVYSCHLGQLTDWVPLSGEKATLLEGVYSMHPQWQDKLDLRIFLHTDGETQRRRILERSGERMLPRFVNEWIPMENRYFDAFSIREDSDLVVDTVLAEALAAPLK